MLILGVDPGLQRTGWGIIRKEGSNLKFIGCGTLLSDSKLPLPARLFQLHEALLEIITHHKPDVSAVEETFVNVNPASTLKLGQARGAILMTLSLAGLPVHEYSATNVKKTVTGSGRAEKEQVQALVEMLMPTSKAHIKGPDAADALAIAICHSSHAVMSGVLK
ncbi:MAG: crossover junction endodeoxyribonuclease RuvC [Alphaproteobacteria bacterium]|nr:crossover junction endodeoxyribonuclease RuvC [Alphaproteobacteria bacterium]